MKAAATDGTAKKLRRAFDPARSDLQIRIFAKTGTPSLAYPERPPVDETLHSLIGRKLIGMRGGNLTVLGQPDELPRAAWTRLRATGQITALLVPESALFARIREINYARRKGQSDGLAFDEKGELRGLDPGPPDPVATRGAAVAFVIGLYRTGADDGQPIRALAVVVNMQAREIDGENRAVTLATCLLGAQGAMARWLLAGVESRSRAWAAECGQKK